MTQPTNKPDGASEEFFELVKAGTNKSIEDVVEEFGKIFSQDAFRNDGSVYSRGKPFSIEKYNKWLIKSLTSLVQQAEREERERITKIVETWLKTSNPAHAQELFDSLSNPSKT